jgi:hypothetical protein
LGRVNVTNYQISYNGYSTPCFFLDQTGDKRLLVGSEEGKVWYFENIPADPEATYQESSDLHEMIAPYSFPVQCGWRTAPAIGSLTNNSWFDLIVGNWAGGLNYFSHQIHPEVLLGISTPPEIIRQPFRIYPNPSGDLIHIHLPDATGNNPLIVQVLNVYGQVVFTTVMSGNATLSVKHLSGGLFFINLTDPSGTFSFSPQKLIVRH